MEQHIVAKVEGLFEQHAADAPLHPQGIDGDAVIFGVQLHHLRGDG
jgi:hypothetical protein